MRGDTLRNMFVLVEYEQSVEVDELIRGRECDSTERLFCTARTELEILKYVN